MALGLRWDKPESLWGFVGLWGVTWLVLLLRDCLLTGGVGVAVSGFTV